MGRRIAIGVITLGFRYDFRTGQQAAFFFKFNDGGVGNIGGNSGRQILPIAHGGDFIPDNHDFPGFSIRNRVTDPKDAAQFPESFFRCGIFPDPVSAQECLFIQIFQISKSLNGNGRINLVGILHFFLCRVSVQPFADPVPVTDFLEGLFRRKGGRKVLADQPVPNRIVIGIDELAVLYDYREIVVIGVPVLFQDGNDFRSHIVDGFIIFQVRRRYLQGKGLHIAGQKIAILVINLPTGCRRIYVLYTDAGSCLAPAAMLQYGQVKKPYGQDRHKDKNRQGNLHISGFQDSDHL